MKTAAIATALLLGGADASISTCASAWKGAGGGNCATAVAVCMAESGGNPSARNTNSDSHHSVDRGLWQINNYWHPEVSDSCAFSAGCNARAALKISSGGSNWTPWATYNGGAYKSHLSAARSACGELAPQEAGFTSDLIYDSAERNVDMFGPGGEKRFGSDEQVGGEPASCKRKLKQVCGHCGVNKGCWLSCAKSHKSELLAAGCKPPKSEAEVTPVHTKEDIFMHHEYDQHCAVLGIPGGKHSKFWKEFGYKYDHFKKGRCPHYYNYVNKRVSDVEGVKNVDMVVRGMSKPMRSFRDVVSQVGSANACPADPCGCCPHDGKGPGACPCLCGGGWCKRCCQ